MASGTSHFWAVSWLAAAALLFLLASGDLDSNGQTAVRAVATTFGLYAIVIAVVFRGRHPGWLAFSGIAIAAWLGTV